MADLDPIDIEILFNTAEFAAMGEKVKATLKATAAEISSMDATSQKSLKTISVLAQEQENLNRTQATLSATYKTGGMTAEQFAQAQTALAVKIRQVQEEASQQAAAITRANQVNSLAVDSIERMGMEMQTLISSWNKLSAEERENADVGGKLVKQFEQVSAAMQKASLSGKGISSNTKEWNGLQVSVNQIARELPSAAVGINTFFLAISNNLPMLFDQLELVKKKNEELATSGQKGVPVWKQLTGALLSWNTAMSVGITLLTIYGKDIATWVISLFKGVDTTKALADSIAYTSKLTKEWNSSLKAANISAGEQAIKLENLNKIATDHAQTYQVRAAAAKELQKEQTGTLQNYSLEEIMMGKVADKIQNVLIPAYKAAAIAQAAAGEIARLELKKMQQVVNKQAQDAARAKIEQQRKALNMSGISVSAPGEGNDVSDVYDMNRRNSALTKWKKQTDQQTITTARNISVIDSKLQSLNKLMETNLKTGASVITNTGTYAASQLKTQEAANKKAEAELKRHADAVSKLQDDIAGAYRDAQQIALPTNEKEIDKINAKFDALEKKAKEVFSGKYGNGLASALKQISEARTLAVNNQTDVDNFNQYKMEVSKMKTVFDTFETYKKEVGEANAAAILGDQMQGQLSYIDWLKAQIKSLDGDDSPLARNKKLTLTTALDSAEVADTKRRQDEQVKLMEDLAAKTETLEKKRLEIQQKYARLRAAIPTDNRITDKSAAGAQVDAAENAELQALNEQYLQQNKAYQALADLARNYSVEELAIRVQRAKEDIQAEKSLTDEQKAQAIASVDEMLAILQKAIPRSREGSLSQWLFGDSYANYKAQLATVQAQIVNLTALQKTVPVDSKEYKDIADALALAKKHAAELGTGMKKAQAIAGDVAVVAGQVANMANTLASAFRGTNDDLSDTMESIGDIAGVVGNIAQGFASGGYVGAGIAAVTSVVSLWGKAKAATAAAKKEVQEYFNAIAKGNQQLAIENYDKSMAAAQRITNSATSVKTQMDATLKAQSEMQAKYQEYLTKLQGEDYISDMVLKKKGLFGMGGKKAVDVMSSMSGFSYDQMAELYAQGKLKDQAKEDFEILKQYKEELDSMGLTLDDLATKWKEIWTGTSLDDLTSQMVDLFAAGNKSAADFADNFKGLMKKAIMSSFEQNFLQGQLSNWYDAFASYSEDGLTESEIEALRTSYNKIISDSADYLDNVEKVTGISFAKDSSSSSGSGGIEQITEQTATELMGITRAQFDEIKRQTNQFYTMINSLQRIDVNTANMVLGVNDVVSRLDMLVLQTSAKTLRDLGIAK